MKYFLFFIFLISFASAVTFDNTIILNTTSSNSSVTFSLEVNATNITIESTYIYLYNASFTNATGFYDCGEINHSETNTVLDSADFVCNFTEVSVPEDEEITEDTSGGSTGGTTYIPSLKDLELSYSKNIRKGFRIRIPVDGNYHHLKVESIEKERILVNISSESQHKWLSIGEEWFVNIDNDTFYEIYVKLNSISGFYANITIKKINKEIEIEEVVKDTTKEEIIKEELPEPIESKWHENKILLVSIIIFISLLIILGGKTKRKSKKKKHRRSKKKK